MINCVIVDDEDLSIKLISELISKDSRLSLEAVFRDPVEGIKYINNGKKIDLVFLDIHMPQFSGFDFIRAANRDIQFVLISSDRNYALQAFDMGRVTDYLLKPVRNTRFKKAIDRVEQFSFKKNFSAQDDSNVRAAEPDRDQIYITIDKRLVNINLPDILFIKAQGNFIEIKTEDKKLLTYSSLKKIQQKLPSHFLQVHRSYIINITKIVDIEDNSILIDHEVIPVSRRHRAELLEKINLL